VAYIHRPSRLVFLANPRTASRSVAKALVEQCGFNRNAAHHAPLSDTDCDFWPITFSVVRDVESTLASMARKNGMSVPDFVAGGFDGFRTLVPDWAPWTLFPFAHASDHVLVYEDGRMDEIISNFLSRYGLGPITLPRIT